MYDPFMRYEQTITVRADQARAWAVLAAVTTWPQWTSSMREVQPLDGDELALGHRFRVKQPGMPALVWRVSALQVGDSFTWETRSPGVRTSGFHRLAANPDGTTSITVGVDQTGPVARLLDLLIGARTRRFLALEAAGLKAASES
ncbi:SRPBCC family protein [Micromonospora gifhornensis]|uniref:SRPBCC family protein n=2 Tax=Micromonospora TaxID=1873 RepID=UPI00364B5582